VTPNDVQIISNAIDALNNTRSIDGLPIADDVAALIIKQTRQIDTQDAAIARASG
jgi:hypothetical protein